MVPNYPRRQAASLICACYNQNGWSLQPEDYAKSVLESESGALLDTWNIGLFRFLDEAIYMLRLVDYFALAVALKKPEFRAQMMLCHQVVKNLIAVRILAASGLDSSCRQNLRALHEMYHALCRSMIDEEFSLAFSDQATPQQANEFWHRYLAKQKNEKFLKEYNRISAKKCLLVVGEDAIAPYDLLGVAAHPNFYGWSFDWSAEMKSSGSVDKMFKLDQNDATELVLSSACHMTFITLDFVCEKMSEIEPDIGFLKNFSVFSQCSSDRLALGSLGKTAGLMSLMLMKLTNRQKENFDPNTHF